MLLLERIVAVVVRCRGISCLQGSTTNSKTITTIMTSCRGHQYNNMTLGQRRRFGHGPLVSNGMNGKQRITTATGTTSNMQHSNLHHHLLQQQQCRLLATSAQKRKLKRKGYIKERGRSLQVEKEQLATLTKESMRERQGFQWTPSVVFLGIFPIVMTGIVLATREDLRKQAMDWLDPIIGAINTTTDTNSTTKPKEQQ